MARNSLLDRDARRTFSGRRARDRRDRRDRRRAGPPIRARVPLAGGVGAVVLAIALAHLAGLAPAADGAVAAGVALGAALIGRRTLGNVAAGAVLRLARPYTPGEAIRVYLPDERQIVDAEIVRIGRANTALLTSAGRVVVPNTRMLRRAPETA